jgi:hypothetical protein
MIDPICTNTTPSRVACEHPLSAHFPFGGMDCLECSCFGYRGEVPPPARPAFGYRIREEVLQDMMEYRVNKRGSFD